MSGSQSQASPALERAAGALRQLSLTTEGPAEQTRSEALAILESYLIPRSADPTAPLNVVFVGPTGSGKSTLINSVMGRSLSPAGFLRPTTAEPLVCLGPDNELTISLTHSAIVRGRAPILEDVTLVDTPDIDSTESGNRRLAFEAVAGADIIVLVASASRYADLEPWALLRQMKRRDTTVIHVVNRVTPESSGAVTDYRRRLRIEGAPGVVVRVAEHQQTPDDMVPAAAVRNLRRAILHEVRAIEPTHRFSAAVGYVLRSLDELRRHVAAERDVLAAKEAELQAGSLLPDLTDIARGWVDQIRPLRRRLPMSRARQARVRSLGDSMLRDLTIAVEGRVMRLFADSEGANLTYASGMVDATLSHWVDTVDPAGPLNTLSPHMTATKLSNIADALVRPVAPGDRESSRLAESLSDLQSQLVRSLDSSMARPDLTLIDDAMVDLGRLRPLAAAVNG